MKKIYILGILILSILPASFAQEEVLDINTMTKEDVMGLTYDQLLELPFEDLLKLAEIVGVSLDELYEMILNKDLVSASKKVESSFESPLSSSVISYDEMRAAGVRTIEEALRLVPGFIVREKTNGNFDAHIRGNDNLPPKHMFLYSENSITLVMIDNRPVYNYVHGGTFWETLPVGIEDVDRIEVVRGPSSALYGPNAVSGVVNIITKKQESEELDVSADVQAGMQSTVTGGFALGKGINDKLSFRVTGNAETMDRNTDKFYVHKYEYELFENKYTGGEVTLDELAELKDPKYPAEGPGSYFVFDPSDNVYNMFPNPLRARQRVGMNGYLFYDLSDDVKMDLKAGYQNSQVISSTMGDNPMSMAGRVSNTIYADYNATIKGLHAQINLLDGWQDIVRQDTGFKIAALNLNGNLEYDFQIGDLNLRPGYSYQLAQYDDRSFLKEKNGKYIDGFLNDKKEFTTHALSLRADYTLFDDLRLILAGRGEKYSTHKSLNLSYQAIASYNINDVHNFRIVSSRANRSPFLVDTYARYNWVRDHRPSPAVIKFEGQENQKLLTMDMIEFGYRIKPTKKIQADIEVFQTKATNYGALYPDSVNTSGGPDNVWVRMRFDNIDLKSKQQGITATLSWIATKDLVFKIFGTYQETKLTNVIANNEGDTLAQEETIEEMISRAPGAGYSVSFPEDRIDMDNIATPQYYGGLIIDYSPIEKLHLNLNAYYYAAQEFASKYSTVSIDSKTILNVKVSYDIHQNLGIYANARNVLGAQKEFGYMDDIGMLILGGLNYNF